MPAIGSRLANAHARGLRLFGLALALVLLASTAVVLAPPVEGRDWTPQIKTTRRAQLYWEDLMRAADKDLQRLKQDRKQATRKLKKTERNLDRAVRQRAAAKQRLKTAKANLATSRKRWSSTLTPQATPAHEVATDLLVTRLRLAADVAIPWSMTSAWPLEPPVAPAPVAVANPFDAREIKRLERSVKQAQRSHRMAQRKARRSQRNQRSVKAKVRSVKAGQRATRGRQQRAEKNLGSWILAMSKFGRIRAVKKSDQRPGVNSRFAWPVRGSLSQRYHAGHDGIDIVRYKGAPIRAMAFGVVTYVGWNPWDQHGRAFMVVVAHAGGYETLYGHLQPKRVVRVGEEVKKGHVIGYMGNTGESTGPHLHLELRRGRTTIDPLGFL